MSLVTSLRRQSATRLSLLLGLIFAVVLCLGGAYVFFALDRQARQYIDDGLLTEAADIQHVSAKDLVAELVAEPEFTALHMAYRSPIDARFGVIKEEVFESDGLFTFSRDDLFDFRVLSNTVFPDIPEYELQDELSDRWRVLVVCAASLVLALVFACHEHRGSIDLRCLPQM